MEATMLLCDAAQQMGGKLYILGGGWSNVFAVGPLQMTLAIKLAVPWDQTNRKHTIRAALVTDDGERVDLGEGPIEATGEIEVGRPPGVKAGSPIDAPFVLPFNGLVLVPGGYVWELAINTDVVSRIPFRVMDAPPMGVIG